MTWMRKAALAVGGTAMALGALAVTAAPAAAVGGCPAGKLCLYESANYKSLALTSTSTKACFLLAGSPGYMNDIGSYVNNLPVNAAVWEWKVGSRYVLVGTIGPGKFSSDAGEGFGEYGAVCMGGLNPNEYFG
ncbi:peptidase inhibitor family I36 protein [[Kitasatospora] papulosa]|uniref:peptidase inhibitor family I36 protein n=2 Tax=Streptomyces TaxID=1883 RepID=UPI002E1265C0|nr:peptidase inhibitor family I36 protein [[Kitasatospora] papulosa]